MKFLSLNHSSPSVDFREATIRGQAPDRGLYFPETIPVHPPSFWKNIREYVDVEIALRLIKPYVGDTIPDQELKKIVSNTLSFRIPLVKITDRIYSIELFHGPTLAFKDVGARFMSQCLSYFVKDLDRKLIVLTATSGDTGAAVADSFYGAENVEVVVLFPAGRVSPVQEKQLTSLGGNIHAIEIAGDFDDCQALVKQAFMDAELNQAFLLTSANSINIARWLPQQFYYALAWKQWPYPDSPPVISVPSGNLGNISAGLLAFRSGMPVKKFIAACNANDVVPQYFQTGEYIKKPAVATISNAMDVADPSNFVRLSELSGGSLTQLLNMVEAFSIDDNQTKNTISEVYEQYGYLLDPHSAVAYRSLTDYLTGNVEGKGLFISTAHPVKFPSIVEQVTGQVIKFPSHINKIFQHIYYKTRMEKDPESLKKYILGLT